MFSNKFGNFENINRSFNKEVNKFVTSLSLGGIYITDEDEIITTVLGSCVSACVRDTKSGIAGMNHFMIVGSEDEINQSNDYSLFQYGLYSMDYMMNKILSLGGSKHTIEIKIFGGGAIISSAGDIGKNNIRFVKNYININGYRLVGEDVGKEFPRKVNYSSKSGKAMVKRTRSLHKQVIAKKESR